MKKIILLIICILLIPISVNAETPDLTKSSKSALIMEYTTGEIVYEKNIHEKLAPASMTKMMSLLVIMEYIENGGMKETDMIKVSQNASSMGGSQIFLNTDEVMSVQDLLKGVAIASANDAVVALAERVAGTEDAFINMMNKKVKELNLKNTNFKNVHGLDEPNHYSSAYDMAMIAKELINHENILEYSSIYECYLRKGTENEIWLVNTNKLVRFYNGSDGLKTGYTKNAGHCLTSTAKKNDMRLITVVMNNTSSENRNKETMDMLDYGFNQYSVETFIKKGSTIEILKISKGVEKHIEIVPMSDVTVLNKLGKKKENVNYELILDDIVLPIKNGDIIGKLQLKDGNTVLREINLTTKNDVNKIGFFQLFLRNLSEIFLGM